MAHCPLFEAGGGVDRVCQLPSHERDDLPVPGHDALASIGRGRRANRRVYPNPIRSALRTSSPHYNVPKVPGRPHSAAAIKERGLDPGKKAGGYLVGRECRCLGYGEVAWEGAWQSVEGYEG